MGKPKPSKKALGKRKAPAPAGNVAKKAKGGKDADDVDRGVGPTGKPKRKPDQPKKVKLRDQKHIPVPRTDYASASEDDLSDLGEDEDLEVGAAAAFSKLDPGMLTRTVKETKRIHALEKERDEMPVARKKRAVSVSSVSDISDYDFDSELGMSDEERSDVDFGSDAPSDMGDSDDEDQDLLNDEYDDMSDLSDSEAEDEGETRNQRKKRAPSEEAEYERAGRARWAEKEEEEADSVEVGRLPIKLPTGEVQLVEGTTRVALPPSKKPVKPEPESEEEEEEESEDEGSDDGRDAARMASQPGRFGRLNIADILTAKWKNAQRLEAAKEQLAALGAEILGGGELVDIGSTLTRLSTFALPSVPNPEGDGEGKIPIPNSIRALAFLSQLAVFKDIIPGYRIRQLTAAEEAEKVRDEVRRQREGEKILVRNYKSYLKQLEAEIKRKTPLSPVALKCMADLLSGVPHFNFSENIMGVLVGRIGRRSWDSDSDLILSTFVSVFKQDVTGQYSQALVRLIARMIKERKFQVHPNVLSCLLHLRLRTELNQMRDGKKKRVRGPAGPEKVYKSEVRKKWQTKNQKKKEKELKEIEKEMAEAEAEVNEEERASVQTETLKNLFVLYFSILKFPGRSALLPAALEGICHFTHLINVDFFRDLLAVIRQIIADKKAEAETEDPAGEGERVRVRMLGIVTAFDLLSGQGEALNIDLADFVDELYALLRPLALDTGIEDPPLLTAAQAAVAAVQRKAGAAKATDERKPAHTLSTSELMFRCLEAIFFPRWGRTPALRCAAFAKRLCEAALTFPPATAREALAFVRRLANKESKLANLLDTEERTFDGVYRPELDDPNLSNPFTTSLYEIDILAQRHWEHKVRGEAKRLREANFL